MHWCVVVLIAGRGAVLRGGPSTVCHGVEKVVVAGGRNISVSIRYTFENYPKLTKMTAPYLALSVQRQCSTVVAIEHPNLQRFDPETTCVLSIENNPLPG